MSNVCILCKKPVLKYSVSKISVHSFPSCPKKRQIWLDRCKLANKEILPNSKICSFHFEPRCFKTGLKRNILYRDAVPTIVGKEKPKDVNKDRAAKRVIASQNHQSLGISPTKAASKRITRQNRVSRYDFTMKVMENIIKTPPCYIPLTRVPSCYIPLTRAATKLITSQHQQSLGISPTKAASKRITLQNCQSLGIPSTSDSKKVLAGKNCQSLVISPVKTVKKGISSQPCQSRDVSPVKTVKKGISSQSCHSRDVSPVKTVKKRKSSQNNQSHDNSPINGVQKLNPGQNHVSHDNLSTGVIELDILQCTIKLLACKKKESDQLNETIAVLEKTEASLKSQLKIVEDKLALPNIAK